MFADQFYLNEKNISYTLNLNKVSPPNLEYDGSFIPDKLFDYVKGESLVLTETNGVTSTYGIILEVTNDKRLIVLPKEFSSKYVNATRRPVSTSTNIWLSSVHFGEQTNSHLEILYLSYPKSTTWLRKGIIYYIASETPNEKIKIYALKDKTQKDIFKVNSEFMFKKGQYELGLQYILQNGFKQKEVTKIKTIESATNILSFRV